METPSLIQDLAVILVLVGSVSLLFTKLGWPKVIGYILAGMLVGKYTFGGSFISNEASVDVLGQLGVIFLMFSLGMEFNLGKLRRVGQVAAPTALLDMAVMIWAGHFVGVRFLGWGSIESLFLGAAISDSATTLLAKTINEMGWGMRRFTRYIFGITITEDIFCIGLIALLTGFAQSGGLDLTAFGKSMGGLSLFLFGVIIFGILLVPRLMNRVAQEREDDNLLLVLLGLCFLLSVMSAKLNFSLALGAFLMGVLVADSKPLKRIERQCAPLRTLFSAIFFVTIGMMVDPFALIRLWPQILGITLLVVVGKSINCTVGALLTGQDLKNAVQTGVGLAQIGEFAYLVALIGISMKVARPDLYQVAIGVSLLTTILNPVLLRASDPLGDWLVSKMPARWTQGLEVYKNWMGRFKHQNPPPEIVRKLWFNIALILSHLVLVATIFIAAGLLANRNYTVIAPWVETYKHTILWAIASLLILPSAIFLFFHAKKIGLLVADAMIPAKIRETRWAEAFRNFLMFFSTMFVMIVFFAESSMLSGSIMPRYLIGRILMGIFLLAFAIVGGKHFKKLGAHSFERLRMALMNEGSVQEGESTAELLDIHTERSFLPRGAAVAGKSLRELHLRNLTGASVIGIDRQGKTIVNPTADEQLQEGDHVLLLGDDTQILAAKLILEKVKYKIREY